MATRSIREGRHNATIQINQQKIIMISPKGSSEGIPKCNYFQHIMKGIRQMKPSRRKRKTYTDSDIKNKKLKAAVVEYQRQKRIKSVPRKYW